MKPFLDRIPPARRVPPSVRRAAPSALLGVVTGILIGCGQGPSDIAITPAPLAGPRVCLDSARQDTVLAVSHNLSIGFRVEDLLFINSSVDSVVYQRAERIYASAARSLPRERIRKIAASIAALRPDVVGLQECLRLERDGIVVMDMLDTLRRDLDSLGMSGWTLHDEPMNRFDMTVRHPRGDSIVVGFHEGLALLVGPRWTVEHANLFPYESVLSVKILGRRATSERAAQSMVLRRDDGFRLEAWNTHLEVFAFQRRNQASELAFAVDSLGWVRRGEGPTGRILFGDLNAEPGLEADAVLRQAGWRDAWEDDPARVGDPGYTCCVSDPRSPLSGYRTGGRRIDRVMHQGGCGVEGARTLLDDWFLTPSGDTLWASDHAMVVARIRYGIRR